MEADTITVGGVTYVRSDHTPTPAADKAMVRSAESGVHYGRLVSRVGDEVVLADARRVWYWAGAATLSQLATDGTTKPTECKFPAPVPSITVLGVCEIIPMTAKAVASLDAVPVWSA